MLPWWTKLANSRTEPRWRHSSRANTHTCHGWRRQGGIATFPLSAFLSYHRDDYDAAVSFVRDFGSCFDAVYTRGVTDGDDFVGSSCDEVILRGVQERYLRDASIAIVLVGESTWGRRFVDWEIAAALRQRDPLPMVSMSLRTAGRVPPRLLGGAALCTALPRKAADFEQTIHQGLQMRERCATTAAPLLRTDLRM